MSVKNTLFQPGAVLHEVIVGAFRSSGSSFEVWCKENDIHTSTARMATYGQSGGDKGKELLNRLIDAAGRETVMVSYRARIETHAAEVSAGVAA